MKKVNYIKAVAFVLALLMLVPPLTGRESAYAETQDPLEEPMVAVGDQHTLVLKTDGTVLGWGNNGNGQLGNGTTSSYYTPKEDPIGVNIFEVKYIATGDGTSFAIKRDGSLWAWGFNSYGQLGLGDEIDRNLPNQVENLQNVIQVSGDVGGWFTAALLEDGTVWTWGLSDKGQHGIGIKEKKELTPVQVKTSSTEYLNNIKSISIGSRHCIALDRDGYVWAWGNNFSGQCGIDGANNEILYATRIETLGNGNAKAIAGNNHTVVLKENGDVWTFGSNSNYELGGDRIGNQNIPQKLAGIDNIQDIAAGGGFTSIKKADGTVWSVGYNKYGVFGTGNARRISPYFSEVFEKSNIEGEVNYLIARDQQIAYILSDSTLWMSGRNESCEIGTGGDSYYIAYPSKVHGLRFNDIHNEIQCYIVNFNLDGKSDWDGGGSLRQRIESGENAVPPKVYGKRANSPQDTTRRYILVNWDESYENINENIEITGEYKISGIQTESVSEGYLNSPYEETIEVLGSGEITLSLLEWIFNWDIGEWEDFYLPLGLNLEFVGGEWEITGIPEELGEFKFGIEAIDVFNYSLGTLTNRDIKVFSLKINESEPPNRAPEVDNPIADITEGTVGVELIVDLTDVFSDPDGDELILTADKGEISGTTWKYTPVSADVGSTITVKITATDPGGLSAEDTFTITGIKTSTEPEPDNHAPQLIGSISDITGKVDELSTVDFGDVFFDEDGDDLVFTLTKGPGIIDGTQWSYTPVEGDENKEYTIEITASDGKDEATTSFKLFVEASEDPEEPPVTPDPPAPVKKPIVYNYVNFSVLDEMTYKPVAGAQIFINDGIYTTDSKGNVKIRDMGSKLRVYIVTKEGYDKISSYVRYPSQSDAVKQENVYIKPKTVEVSERLFLIHEDSVHKTWVVLRLVYGEFNRWIKPDDFMLGNGADGYRIDEVQFVDERVAMIGLEAQLGSSPPTEDMKILARASAFTSKKSIPSLTAMGDVRIIPSVGGKAQNTITLSTSELVRALIPVRPTLNSFSYDLNKDSFTLGGRAEGISISQAAFFNLDTAYITIAKDPDAMIYPGRLTVFANPGAFVDFMPGTRDMSVLNLNITEENLHK